MSDTSQQNQVISDDQELAKVLQGMQQQNRTMATSEPGSSAAPKEEAQYEEAPIPAAPAPAPVESIQPQAAPLEAPMAMPAPANDPAPLAAPLAPLPSVSETAPPAPTETTSLPQSASEFDTIKKEALEELRPLVTKLDLPPKEKFDTMLLIIRSTDDKSLLGPAHDAARAIPDDIERAQALLDVIKEIDYFSTQNT